MDELEGRAGELDVKKRREYGRSAGVTERVRAAATAKVAAYDARMRERARCASIVRENGRPDLADLIMEGEKADV